MSGSNLSPEQCQVPTLYFIGVTATRSSIMRIFPEWSTILGLDAAIVGIDLSIDTSTDQYRSVVQHIKDDPLAMGALVTTHKINLLAATSDLFDDLDPHARLCGEISCISKQNNRLQGHAKDPISSGLAWQALVDPGYWPNGAQVMCIGAGGAAVAISVYVAGRPDPADRPSQFIIIERESSRLESLQAIHAKLDTSLSFEYVLNDDPRKNDKMMSALPPRSMVINATGMGKDRPGSPLTDGGIFPDHGLVWELNYRGELDFLCQAQRQTEARNLTVEDGWTYFLHGWTQVIAEVFDRQLTPELFAQLDNAASKLRPKR